MSALTLLDQGEPLDPFHKAILKFFSSSYTLKFLDYSLNIFYIYDDNSKQDLVFSVELNLGLIL